MPKKWNIHFVFAWIFALMNIATVFTPFNVYNALIGWLTIGLIILEIALGKRLNKKRFREQFKR